MSHTFLLILQTLIFSLGLSAILISIHAFRKGSVYIALSNRPWNDRSLEIVFGKQKFWLTIFKVTPIVIFAVSIWAGYSVCYSLLWPLGDIGFVDHEYEEWVSYRESLSITLGCFLGGFFGSWLINTCERGMISSTSQISPAPSAVDLLLKVLDKSATR